VCVCVCVGTCGINNPHGGLSLQVVRENGYLNAFMN
jgi:hypothetical protein